MIWIHINTALPGFDQKVLTFRKWKSKEGEQYATISTGFLLRIETSYNYRHLEWRCDDMDGYELDDITHWMLLPEPPQD